MKDLIRYCAKHWPNTYGLLAIDVYDRCVVTRLSDWCVSVDIRYDKYVVFEYSPSQPGGFWQDLKHAIAMMKMNLLERHFADWYPAKNQFWPQYPAIGRHFRLWAPERGHYTTVNIRQHELFKVDAAKSSIVADRLEQFLLDMELRQAQSCAAILILPQPIAEAITEYL